MSTATMEYRDSNTPAIHLSFSSADEIHDGLGSAVAALIDTATLEGQCGILVTRVEPGQYTVALDESVPFGKTYEDLAA